MQISLKHAHQYTAVVHLGFFQQVASNQAIVERLKDAGFTSVTVTGTGSTRYAAGTWNGPDAIVDVPAVLQDVREVTPAS